MPRAAPCLAPENGATAGPAGRSPGRRQRTEPSAVDIAVGSIRASIAAGQIVPGQRLPEGDLAQRLSISRSSLREAFVRLEGEGLVEIVRNRGALVRKLGMREVANLMAIRQALEGLAARLAAEAIGEADVQAAFQAIAKPWLEGIAAEDFEAFMAENVRFHRGVIAASGNPELAALIERLNLPLFTAQFRTRIDLAGRMASAREHREVAEAILAGDGPRAEAAMAGHIGQTRAIIEGLVNV